MGSKHQERALDIRWTPDPEAAPSHHGEVGHRTHASLSWLQKGLLSAALK